MHAAFARLTAWVADATGRPATFMLALATVLVWAASGPLFHFSDTWQLVINTGTTVITFLMVFLVQAAQNRQGEQQAINTAAILAMTAELVRKNEKADDRVIPAEAVECVVRREDAPDGP